MSKIIAFADAMNKVMLSGVDNLNAKLKKVELSIDRILAALAAAVMLSYIVQLCRNGAFGDLNAFFNSINFVVFILLAVLACGVMIILTVSIKLSKLIPWALMLLTAAVSLLFALNYTGEHAVYFAVGVGLIDFAVVLWEVKGDKLGVSGISISRRAALIAAAVLFVAATAIFGYLTSLKYRTYSTFTFDFGIFSQMFERMAQTGLPYTTVERSYMMLHYGVHFSPFFYLFLPGYFIFRTPIYLYFIQSAGVAAGVFAVWLLAGKLGLSGKLTLAFEVLYLFYPCLFDGTFYDFHENKFLTAVILFLFYFILSKKPLGIFGFSLLLLSIKEDAAIYLMVIAVFVMLYRKEIFTGVAMLLMAIIYFIIAQQIVAASGVEGVMMSRLQDYFINGEKTFGSVIKAVLCDIGHTIQQVFTAEKIPFILWMFAPVLFAPFMNKRLSSLVLLLPILPINLMQSWSYQYNVDYQYTYGVAAMILFSAILAIMQLGTDRRRTLLLTSLCVCMVMSVTLNAPKIKNVTSNSETYQQTYQQIDDLLDEIPDDAVVTSSDAFVPHLYKTKWLFTIPDYYTKNQDKLPILPGEADYCVIDTRYSSRVEALHELMGDNYTLIRSAGFAELYERNVKVEVRE